VLDKARIMNAEAMWLLTVAQFTGDGAMTAFSPGPLTVKVEAVSVDGYPYRRRTLTQLDEAIAGCATRPIYAELGGSFPSVMISPTPRASAQIEIRFLSDIPDPVDTASESPPFPDDLHSALADGAIATGLARMDERFDSAGYFDARFADAIARCRHRRNSRVGRGGVPIRLVT